MIMLKLRRLEPVCHDYGKPMHPYSASVLYSISNTRKCSTSTWYTVLTYLYGANLGTYMAQILVSCIMPSQID